MPSVLPHLQSGTNYLPVSGSLTRYTHSNTVSKHSSHLFPVNQRPSPSPTQRLPAPQIQRSTRPCAHYKCFVLYCILYCIACAAVRLAGGNQSRGRLEYYHSGSWGTVCDHDFDDLSASVACRQLGFQLASQFLLYQLFSLVNCDASKRGLVFKAANFYPRDPGSILRSYLWRIIGQQSEGSLIRGFDSPRFDNLVLTLTLTLSLTLGLSIVRTWPSDYRTLGLMDPRIVSTLPSEARFASRRTHSWGDPVLQLMAAYVQVREEMHGIMWHHSSCGIGSVCCL